MSKSFRKDLTGQRFGRLTVLEFMPDETRHTKWKCKCDCGNIKIVEGANLKSGNTQSCGCLIVEQSRINGKKSDGTQNLIHGKTNSRLYRIWGHIKTRCTNPNANNYKDYGGRGITVCDEWKNDFQSFYNWAISNGYSDDLSIDRIDNDGDYEPLNCRWSDKITQGCNKRNNRIVSYKGKKICLSELSRETGIDIGALDSRYRRGDRGERLVRPIKK